MKGATAFSFPRATWRVLSRTWRTALQLLYQRTILVLAVMFCVGLAAVLWHLVRLSSTLVEASALQGTARYSEALMEFRSLYTSEVVVRAQARGIEVTHDYRTKPAAIPLPATLSIELGRRIGMQGSGLQVRLYSDYPFPWRVDGGPRDAFEREALRHLQQHPDQPFTRFEDFEGRRSLRYATADRMRPACVSCHNSHPASPRKDWKVGDVRGILEVIRPLDSVMAESRAGVRQTGALLGAVCALWLGGLALAIGRLRQTNVELERKVDERTLALGHRSTELATANANLEKKIVEHERTEEALAKRTAELEDARSFLDSVLENLPVMLFVKDARDLRFVRWNRAEEEALGIDRALAIGKNDYDFFPPEQADFFVEKDRAVLNGGERVDIAEEAIQTPHRGLRFLHTIKVPVMGADGTPKYLVGISEDITERKQAEEQLARAREQEVEIGFKIQQTLLLDQPPRNLPGVHVAALTIPSQRIDGDFYDFFKHMDKCLDVIVGDVMGKGIPAALLGAATKSHFLQALSHLISLAPPGTRPEPKDIVTLAHSEVARQLIELESFVTLCYARFDLENSHVDLVDCGHTTTLHFQASTGTCVLLHGDNLPLGVRDGEIYEQIRVPLHPGDVLLFYSDGLTETRNSAGELFGIDRLAECVRAHGRLDPEALIEEIRRAAVAFSSSETFGDDLTCVAVRIEARARPLYRAAMEISSDLKELARARAFVREFCRTLSDPPMGENAVNQLELAITEAASNVMEHAYGGRTDQQILLDAEAWPDRVLFRLHHLGESFDPDAVKPPVFDGTQDGGFGVYIIAQSVDEVRYDRDERGRNRISLVKNRKTT
jgi:phosphoserine phosphatase RsbU/P